MQNGKNKNQKFLKNLLTNSTSRDNISLAVARVVELADSLDSGSSVHSGRAGSSPASRTKQTPTSFDVGVCFMSEVTP